MTTFMIYGANGYTGRLIAREAARRGMKPVLAGRNRESVAQLAAELGMTARVFGLGGCRHGLEPVLAHITDAIDDPFHVGLYTASDVTKHRRVMRPHDGPEVREA